MADPYSAVRPEDEEWEWGMPSAFTNAELKFSGEAAKAEDNAMSLLRQSLNQQPEVTPTQGIAAALLAAIPTIGGYMIGKSVGDPNIPDGVTMDMSKYQTGGYAGGLMGMQAGAGAADSYLKGLQAQTLHENEVEQKMASLEAQKAARMQGLEGQVVSQGLAAQARRDEIPLEEASRIRIAGAESAMALARQKQLEEYRNGLETLPPEARGPANAALGLPPDANLNPAQMRVVTQAVEAGRRARGQEFRQDEIKGAEQIPGARVKPGFNPDPPATNKAREALANYNEMSQIYLPELKRVFTNPNASTDDKVAAIAGTVIALKKQQGMGANFTIMENALIMAGLPKIAQLDGSSLTAALKASLQGQDALAKINRLQTIVNQSVAAQIDPYGYELDTPGGVGAPSAGGFTVGGIGAGGKKITSIVKVN